ncbi:MAG: hypothetical protein ACOYMW_02490 [Candidatus Competibacteraceae bacterium]
MSDDLEHVSAELLARLVKQKSSSSQIGPTQELGGIARASALLEKLLRLVLKDMAEAMDTTADALVTRTKGEPVNLNRATGGLLLSALKLTTQETAAESPCVRMIVREVCLPNNRILRVIKARNKTIHGTNEPASARTALVDLKSLIEEYRRDAGWET